MLFLFYFKFREFACEIILGQLSKLLKTEFEVEVPFFMLLYIIGTFITSFDTF